MYSQNWKCEGSSQKPTISLRNVVSTSMVFTNAIYTNAISNKAISAKVIFLFYIHDWRCWGSSTKQKIPTLKEFQLTRFPLMRLPVTVFRLMQFFSCTLKMLRLFKKAKHSSTKAIFTCAMFANAVPTNAISTNATSTNAISTNTIFLYYSHDWRCWGSYPKPNEAKK